MTIIFVEDFFEMKKTHLLKDTHKHTIININYCNATRMMQNILQILGILCFKIIVYIKYKFKFFLVLKFLAGRWSVGRWSVHLVGGRLVSGQWSVVCWSVGSWSVEGGLLVGGFKKTPLIRHP